MSGEDLLNNPLSEILKSDVDKINPEPNNQNVHDVLPTNVGIQAAGSTAKRNEIEDKQSSDKEKKGINKTQTEETPPSETKKTVKKLFSFETLVKAMHRGEVPTLLAEHSLQGIPHRGISVERMCVPLIALIGNKMIKNGKVVDREIVELLSSRRNLSSVGKIKAYDSNQHEQLLTTLSSRNGELLELNAFTEGQRPLFNNVSTKVLTINLRSSCTNMKFVECRTAEFLWWNSSPAGRGMLKHFPALKGVAYSDCRFLKQVSIPPAIKILICFNKQCKCEFRTVFGKRKRPYVISCPTTCQGGPAMLAYAELTDIWRLGQWTQIFT